MGKNGESSRGKMGENGGKWGEMGENGEEMGRKWGERGPAAPPKFPYFPPFFPISPPFFPIFPHFPPFFPIFPHFSLPWVHCGYVCGYSTRHRSRVLLSPDRDPESKYTSRCCKRHLNCSLHGTHMLYLDCQHDPVRLTERLRVTVSLSKKKVLLIAACLHVCMFCFVSRISCVPWGGAWEPSLWVCSPAVRGSVRRCEAGGRGSWSILLVCGKGDLSLCVISLYVHC